MPFEPASAARVRAIIARTVLGEVGEKVHIAGITLQAHQTDALARVRGAIARFGGALLADATGLGKTHVALALAREAPSCIVIAPAALRPMWCDALQRAHLGALFMSMESLSRGRAPLVRFDLVIVDEAHHFRNPRTQRYAALAALTRRANVLLLSATPIHNRRRDVHAVLALFLGARAARLDDEAMASCIVRRTITTVDLPRALPRIVQHPALTVSADPLIADRLAALPPPVPASDEGDAPALIGMLMHRLWSSSDAALRAGLRKRRARAIALTEALASGRVPTRAELALWTYGDGAVQLAFPELLNPGTTMPSLQLSAVVERHERALGNLLATIPRDSPRDRERADLIRAVRLGHPGARIVAFAAFGATVAELWRQLSSDTGVCALTSRGARVAGGELTREDALARFAPRAHDRPEPRASERIDLLLCTDLLSEGVNLQDASVVIHLDLPWTPARIEQRIGRVARLGSAYDEVHIYTVDPPPLAERALALSRRLAEKMAAASAVVGKEAPVQEREAIRGRLRSWLAPHEPPRDVIPAAAVKSSVSGVLLLWQFDDAIEFQASLSQVVLASGADAPVSPRLLAELEAAAARSRHSHRQGELLQLDEGRLGHRQHARIAAHRLDRTHGAGACTSRDVARCRPRTPRCYRHTRCGTGTRAGSAARRLFPRRGCMVATGDRDRRATCRKAR